jgi:hypothetical protein
MIRIFFLQENVLFYNIKDKNKIIIVKIIINELSNNMIHANKYVKKKIDFVYIQNSYPLKIRTKMYCRYAWGINNVFGEGIGIKIDKICLYLNS